MAGKAKGKRPEYTPEMLDLLDGLVDLCAYGSDFVGGDGPHAGKSRRQCIAETVEALRPLAYAWRVKEAK